MTPHSPPTSVEGLHDLEKYLRRCINGASASTVTVSVERLSEAASSIGSYIECLEGHEKHRQRAVDAIALHLCSTDLTDGFCGPRDGKCIGQNGERPSHRNCVVKANGCMQAMQSCGVHAVWVRS